MSNYLVIPSEWQQTINKIGTKKGIVLVLGATDSGKTTFCTLLANYLTESGNKVALVDADVGQSEIGPPTTIGLGITKAPVESLRQIPVEAIHFIGSTSPEGHLKECIAGTKKMVQKAQALQVDYIIVDTTGLVFGPAGRKLKEDKIQAIKPEHIVALQKESEIEPIVSPYQNVYRLPVPEQVEIKSRELRKERREKRSLEYFRAAKPVSLNLKNLKVSGAVYTGKDELPGHFSDYISRLLETQVVYAQRLPNGIYAVIQGNYEPKGLPLIAVHFNVSAISVIPAERFKNLLVGLLAEKEETLGIGILKDLQFKTKKATILTPVEQIEEVNELRFGALRLQEDGTELEIIKPGDI